MSDALGLCHNTVLAFFRNLDDNRYEALAARLAPDGIWHRQGKALQGREAVLQALALRSPTQRIHHLITNLLADGIGADRCEMRGYMLVVRHDDGQPIAGPAPLTGIENIRPIHASLARFGSDWLITRLGNDALTFAAQAKGTST